MSQILRCFYRFMKRKTVQTKYDVPVRRAFRWASEQQSCSAEASMIVRIPAPWLTKEIIFVCTVFLSFTLRMTCERTLIHAHLRCELHHRICNLRYGTHGYGMSVYIGFGRRFHFDEQFNAGSISSQKSQCRSMCWSKMKNM